MLRRVATAWLLFAVVPGCAMSAAAQVPDDSVRARALRDFHGPDGTGKDGPLHKAGLDLLMLYHRYRQADDGTFSPVQSRLRVAGGRVVVDAVAGGTTDSLRADLERLGMRGAAVAGRVVSGRLPVEQIPAAARLETLRGLTPSRAQTRTSPSLPGPPEAPAAPAPQRAPSDSPDAPDPPPPGPLLFLLGSALTVLFLEAR